MLAVLFIMGPRALAADTHSITIESKTSGHTYQAYQIFAGDYYEGVLSNIQWGSGVNPEALLGALKADTKIGSHFNSCETAADVAEALESESFQDNSDNLDAFANAVSGHLAPESDGVPAVSGDPAGSPEAVYVYTISGLTDGYYFVNEKTMTDDDGNAYTKFMLQVTDDETVTAKAEVPALDKKIDGSQDTDPSKNDAVTANNAAIGDKVPFQVTSKVPAMDGYEKYYFVVTDTLSPGLSFNQDVSVKIGDTGLTKDTDYTVEVTKWDKEKGQTVTIILKNFKQYKDEKGEKILLTYSATVNENAAIGTGGNKNSAKLIYSNDPNTSDGGEPTNPDKPGANSPVGETPDSDTYTYVTGLELRKINPDKESLTGAKFELTGTRLNKVLVHKDVFTEDQDGTYWKLKDGSYTKTSPVTGGGEGDTSDLYDDPLKKYTRSKTTETVTVTEGVKATGMVDNDGILRFDGLAAGEYTIKELKAPDGYNLLATPVKITINWTAPVAPSAECVWTVTGEDGGDEAKVEDGIVKLSIENESGFLLPSTGGAGTTAFYIAGIILILGGSVLFFIRKRTRHAGNEE